MSADGCAPLVITGATGFIGQQVVRLLRDHGARRVTMLGRHAGTEPLPDGWTHVQVDLTRDPVPDGIMPGSTVLHLAASTGKAAPAVMRRTNVDGTARLVDAARTHGARGFVFVSSIAAGYTDRRWYAYAESKRDAEAIVSAAGIPYSIVRPTMGFGPGSPVQRGLSLLAQLPVPVLFGDGRVMVQPIDVLDVARLLVGLGVASGQANRVLEAGGADRLTMRDLMAELRRARGLDPRAPLHLPLLAFRMALGAVEPLARPVLPLTAGQLAAFANDSMARPDPLLDALMPAPRRLADLLGAAGDA